MIFGGFNLSGLKSKSKKTAEIKSFMSWPEANPFYIDFYGFNGGFFLNPIFPTRPDEFIFINENRSLFILISGNIYNNIELIDQVKAIAKISNPKLVSQLFLKFGSNFVTHLNGDFAIVVYDHENEDIFLYRDHLGIQPLFFTFQEKCLFFSSDSISLSRAFQEGEPLQIDPLISTFKAVDHLLTLNPKVEKVKPGHYIHLKNGVIEPIKYWYPEEIKPNKKLSYTKVLSEAKLLLNDSIRIRCDKRYNAGVHLSGGLDSSIVAAIVRKNYPEQETFYGFSWSPKENFFNDVPYDERDLVKETAKKNNITPIFNSIGKEDTINYVKNYFDNLGYFPEAKTIENAMHLNVNLLFSGWGGDEFISKEGSGIDTDLLFQLKIKAFFERNPITKHRKLAQTLYYFILLPALGVLDRPMKKAYKLNCTFIKKEFRNHHKPTLKRFFFYKSRRDRHLNFLYNYYLSERTEWWKLMGFKNGIEYRYPLLDKRIIEFILKVPSHLMFRGKLARIILRDLGKSLLPDSVIYRTHYNDPVYGKNKANYNKELFFLFKDEVYVWKENKDLCFIDFDILEKELGLFETDPTSKDFSNLFSNVVFFKSIHEFTKTYRSLPPEVE